MTIKERIKELCDRQGLSLNQVEKECKLGKGYLSKLDVSSPTVDKLGKVAKRLGVTMSCLLGEENPSFSPENAKLVSMIRADKNMNNFLLKYFKLSKEKRAKILSAVNMIMDGMEND